MIVKRTIPGYIWFNGNEIFKLRFHDELFNLHSIEYRDHKLMRINRIKKRKEKLKTQMRCIELFILTMWASIIVYAAVRAF